MKENDVIEILKYIADSDEECALDVIYGLSLLETNIEGMLESIKDEMKQQLNSNQFGRINKLNEFCNNITKLDNEVKLCLKTLAKQSDNARTAVNEIDYINRKKVPKSRAANIDYEDYMTDRFEEHTLDEDYTYSKLDGIRIDGKLYEVHSWREALITICEELYKSNSELMESFCNDPAFQGKKIKYFSKKEQLNQDGMPRNMKIGTSNLYVWTNQSANAIAKMIKKIAIAYGINPAAIKIYIRADYKELHNKTNC